MYKRWWIGAFTGFILLLWGSSYSLVGQTVGAQRQILSRVDEEQMRELPRNTHPFARPEFDQGAAPADLPMKRMLLVLNRSAEQAAALQSLIEAQQNPREPEYRKWLTPEEFGVRFGVADSDIQTITSWPQSQGFEIGDVSKGKNVIEFSGTAGQVRNAFRTEIHNYVVNGEEHWANASNPQIPAALWGVVAGVATLHNFTKKTNASLAPQTFEAMYRAGEHPQLTSNGIHALAPADFATIYNLNPLFQEGANGWTENIAVVGRTNIDLNDVYQFRNIFSLSPGSVKVTVTGTDPGNLGGGEKAEAVLDVSWAGATAPGADVRLVVSKTTNATDGVDLSENYIINNNLAAVMTESFGSCEANFTQAQADLYSSLAEQAAAQGITYLVASGDSGSAGCSEGSDNTSDGVLSVNLLASNPYVVAVGGTQFNEGDNSIQYWSSSTSTRGLSVLSYIPEIVWNESCSSLPGSNPCPGGSSPGLWAGGGGASNFYSKPSWQSGVPGVPNDGKRDVPDVSFTAAGHDPYLLCLHGSCTPNSRGLISLYGYAGTSAATPSFAGIVASALSKVYWRVGALNYLLYPLAARQNFTQCNGSSASGPLASTCVFNDVTVGNNVVPGTSDGSYQATLGYDLATGLGSVNAANLGNALAASYTGTPVLDISSHRLDFGQVYLGMSQTQQITIRNTGAGNLSVRDAGQGLINTPFRYGLTCGTNIIQNGTCTLQVTFLPTSGGALQRTILLLTNSAEPFVSITVTGTGVVTTAASLSTSALDFGNQKIVTRSNTKAITVTNSTIGPIAIGSLVTAGAPNDFILANTCPTSLAVASSCTMYVSFAPQLAGSRSASLTIPVGNGTTQRLTLSGTGTMDGAFEIVSSATGKVLGVAARSSSNGAVIQQSALDGYQSQHWQLLPVSEGYYAIQNVLTGKVLDVRGASAANGAVIQQWDYFGGAHQQWQVVAIDDYRYKIINRGSGKALDLPGGSTANGTPMQQWDYVGNPQQLWAFLPTKTYNITSNLSGRMVDVQGGSGSNGALIRQSNPSGYRQQEWQFMPVGRGYFAILNRSTGKVLDLPGGSTTAGMPIQQWDYLGGPNQQWQIVLLDGTNYKIINRASGKALDDTGHSLVSGTVIQQWDYSGDTNQQWQLTPVTYYGIVNKASGLALDVPGGSTDEGTPIQQWQSLGNQQQQWQIVEVGGGYRAIVNDLTGKVLANGTSSNNDGAPAQEQTYSAGDNQKWRFTTVPGGFYEIVNRASGKSLDVTAGSSNDGAVMQQWSYLGGGNQQWQFVAVPD